MQISRATSAFATRLKSATEAVEWIESVGGLAANKPVRDWIDNDIDRATFEISDLSARFKRVEAVAKTLSKHVGTETVAIVVGQGKDTKALVQTVEISSDERELAQEAVIELRARISAKGLSQSKLLSVVAEVAREILATQDLADRTSPDSDDDVKGTGTWRN